MSLTILDSTVSALEQNNILLCIGDIDESFAARVVAYLFEREYRATKPDAVKLIINSAGGECNEFFSMIDAMKSVSYPVYTYGIGKIYSCGLLLFMAGEAGHRHLFKNTSIMSHQWSGWSEGKKHEIEASEKENKMISAKILKHYIDCTGLPSAEINDKLMPASDVWLSPKEAIKFNLADTIITKIK